MPVVLLAYCLICTANTTSRPVTTVKQYIAFSVMFVAHKIKVENTQDATRLV